MTTIERTNGAAPAASPRRSGGEILATMLHVVLLAAVLGQIVYLGSRYRWRMDATSDDIYSLTESTTKIVHDLDKRLLIEAYVSPKEDLPAQLRDTRTVLDNFLDELVQLGHGKIAVQRFNPLEDKTIQDKCTRVGIKAIELRTSSTNALEVKRHWQGLRLVYGGGRQKIIEQIGPRSTFEAEAAITPAIKEVVTLTKKKIGFMEWPVEPPQGQQQALGWSSVRGIDPVARRYDFQNVKDAESTLIPDDIDTLMLFRPSDLGDRQKYVIDQFLMRGGSVIVFADVTGYGIAPRRQFNRTPLPLDAKDSEVKWHDQLLAYGIDLTGRIVADLLPDAWRTMNGGEYLGQMTQLGFAQQIQWFPYFFHPVERNWADAADELAKLGGRKDPALVQHYKDTLHPGIDSEEFLFKAFKRIGRGPGFYWPCEVDLRRRDNAPDLPAGVQGRVLLWSSPRSLVEDAPQSTDPIGGGDMVQQRTTYNTFVQKLKSRIDSEAPRQAALMVDLRGTFPSAFAGRPRPKRPAEIKEEEAKKAEAEAAAKNGDDKAADPEQKPKEPAPDAPTVGPEPPKELQREIDKEQGKAPPVVEAEQLQTAKAPGRIVVVGDSDFLRDDLVRGDYRQLGGPQSAYGGNFFLLLVDWLSQDSDLVALQSRGPIDRKLTLVPATLDRVEDPRDAEQRLEQKRSSLVRLNAVAPGIVLLVLGLLVYAVRRAQKRQFLASVGN